MQLKCMSETGYGLASSCPNLLVCFFAEMGQPTCCLTSVSVAVHLQEVGLGIKMS